MSEVIPTIVMYGPKGRVKVNVSDQADWAKKGYALTPKAAESTESGQEADVPANSKPDKKQKSK